MFLNFGIFINAILLVLGGLWCREMLGRLGKDVEDYRSAKDPSTRQALILLWLVTAVIVLLMLDFLWGLLRNVGLL